VIALALAGLLGLAPPPEAIEAPVPGSGVVVAQALFPAEGLGRRDGPALRILAAAMLRGTAEFSAPMLLRYGAQAGAPPRVEAGPDFLRVTVQAPAGEASLAGQLLESLVVRPSLREEDLAEAARELRGAGSPWLTQALEPAMPDWDRPRPRDVREMYLRLLRPERMVLVVAGELAPGDAAAIAQRFADWRPPRPPRPVPDPPQPPRVRLDAPVSIAQLAGAPIAPTDATRLLAVVALGSGKGSSLFRVLRGRLDATYFQQAVLLPMRQGWEPRLVWARMGDVDIEAARAALLEDVAAWTGAEADRAREFAAACLLRGLPATPFLTGPEAWLEAGPRGAADWAALMAHMGAPGLARQTLIEAMRHVDAEALREAATEMVTNAQARLLPGS
jgi:hypothetical protein